MKRLFKRHRDRHGGRDTPPREGSTAPTPPPPSTPIFPSGIKLLHKPEGEAQVDIVFVHGLTGHREKTWTARDATEPWPKTLLPTKIPNARVLTFGYDASVADWRSVVSESRIGNHSMNLLTALANFRDDDDTNERPIIFVCHSMGGLVCEDALVSSGQRPQRHLQNILSSTKGIVFLGTPHHGSGLAVWAERLSVSIGLLKQTNPSIVQVLRRDSEVLARIQDSFHTMIQSRTRDGLRTIEITCFYEELPLPVVGLVVPQDSAILPGYIPIGIHNNHQDMTKFVSVEDPGFVAVCAELRRWTKETRTSQVPQNQPPVLETKAEESTQDAQDNLAKPEEPEGHFLVPHAQNPDFVGRSNILDRLKREFGHDRRHATGKGRPRVCLHGLGGVGKTQIALRYTYWLRETRPDISIFWVHASNANRFRQAFVSIAEECDIPGHKSPSADILPLVKTWLQKKDHGPWFLVIDNADDPHLFFSQSQEASRPTTSSSEQAGSGGTLGYFIPECGHGSILITTRNKQAGVKLAPGRPPIEVEKMSDDESAQMIRALSGDDELSNERATLLSARLENLPLALAQASAFMQENSMNIDRYLEILDNSDDAVVRLLSQDFRTVGRDSEVPHAVMLTWVVSFEQIKQQHPLASEILSLIAFFDRQAIPRRFLILYLNGTNDEEFEYYYNNRQYLGFNQEGGGDDSEDEGTEDDDYDESEDPHSGEENEEGLGETQEEFSNGGESYGANNPKQDESNDDDEWETASGDSSNHPSSPLSSAPSDDSEPMHENMPTQFSEDPDSIEELPETVAVDPMELEKALGILKAFSLISEGNDQSINMHRLVQLATKTWLANMSSERQFSGKALQTLASFFPIRVHENMKVCKATLPHAYAVLKNDVANTYQNILLSAVLLARMGLFYFNSVQIGIAAATLHRAMTLVGDRLGKTHPLLLRIRRLYVHSLLDLDRLEEAVQALSTLTRLQRRVYPENHREVLGAQLILGLIYRSERRFQEAKETFDAALSRHREEPGKPSTMKMETMIKLAQTLAQTGQLQEAEEKHAHLAKLAQRYYGVGHPLTLNNVTGYAETLRLQGRLEEAEALCRQTLEGQDVFSSHSEARMLTIMRQLADVLREQNRLDETEDIEVQVLDHFTKFHGKDNPNSFASMAILGFTRHKQGRLEEAEDMYSQAFDVGTDIYGSDNPKLLRCMYEFAVVLRKRRKNGKAKELMEDAVQRHLRRFGPDHPGTRDCQDRLRDWEEEDSAGLEPHALESLEIK